MMSNTNGARYYQPKAPRTIRPSQNITGKMNTSRSSDHSKGSGSYSRSVRGTKEIGWKRTHQKADVHNNKKSANKKLLENLMHQAQKINSNFQRQINRKKSDQNGQFTSRTHASIENAAQKKHIKKKMKTQNGPPILIQSADLTSGKIIVQQPQEQEKSKQVLNIRKDKIPGRKQTAKPLKKKQKQKMEQLSKIQTPMILKDAAYDIIQMMLKKPKGHNFKFQLTENPKIKSETNYKIQIPVQKDSQIYSFKHNILQQQLSQEQHFTKIIEQQRRKNRQLSQKLQMEELKTKQLEKRIEQLMKQVRQIFVQNQKKIVQMTIQLNTQIQKNKARRIQMEFHRRINQDYKAKLKNLLESKELLQKEYDFILKKQPTQHISSFEKNNREKNRLQESEQLNLKLMQSNNTLREEFTQIRTKMERLILERARHLKQNPSEQESFRCSLVVKEISSSHK